MKAFKQKLGRSIRPAYEQHSTGRSGPRVSLASPRDPVLPGTKTVERCPSNRAVAIVSVLSTAPWLILPVVICLSQRLSHASLSISQIKAKPQKAH